MEKKYDYSFKDLKAKVGIDDVALSLGYQIDRRAGIGRYIELVLPGSDGRPTDRIIISHPNDKSHQSYFRRSNGRLGDVFDFVKENKSSFGETGKSDWEIAAKVLAKFANEPLPQRDNGYYQAINRPRVFDITKYDVRPLTIQNKSSRSVFDGKSIPTMVSEPDLKVASDIFKQRGIKDSTVRAFAEHIHLVRDSRLNYPGYNLGFPYTRPGNNKVEGYEIRGYGTFKSKALGTNSTTAAWIATNPGPHEVDRDPNKVRNVYFAESAYDIMSFYQFNEARLYNPMMDAQSSNVFVSIGGTFSPSQVKDIMEHYPNAKAVDCFDNDIPGRIYGMRMVNVVENLGLQIAQTLEGIEVKYKGAKHTLPLDSNLNELKKFISLKRSYSVWKAPKEYKDWNDVVQNRPMVDLKKVTKYDRNNNLKNSREGGMKL